MVNKCIECTKIANFNLEGEKGGKYCFTHKKQQMVDVVHKRCAENGCKTQPSFNIEGEKCGLFCFKHKTENMIDIKNFTCIE